MTGKIYDWFFCYIFPFRLSILYLHYILTSDMGKGSSADGLDCAFFLPSLRFER